MRKNIINMAKEHCGSVDKDTLALKVEEYFSCTPRGTEYIGGRAISGKEYDSLVDFTSHYGSTPEKEYADYKIKVRGGSVTHIYAHGRGIDLIPESISDFSKLEFLNLDDNRIRDFPSYLEGCENLRILHLSGNNLKDSGVCRVGNLPNLEMLFLDSNGMGEIPESVGDLKKLATFHASKNLIQEVPESLGGIKTLKWVTLSSNGITSLPKYMGSLKMVDKLDLRGNPITGEAAAKLKKAFGNRLRI